MTPGEKQRLVGDVERIKVLNAEIQSAKWTIKEIADAAWDAYGVKGKVVKQLAKEAAWDQVQREERRQFEGSLDECRAALGLLADLPLGQAAAAAHAGSKANGSAAPEKRGRGRPKGSRNKPKPVDSKPGEWTRPPRDDPPVPDFPDAA
ncbi:MAG TPA: hypothetical protein VG758_21225 [Hyphomicrobiaceae bacterium]|jgi:hypothetical protein|nr:hypothetical protein [Hyphomicrobiaceae bacterium]